MTTTNDKDMKDANQENIIAEMAVLYQHAHHPEKAANARKKTGSLTAADFADMTARGRAIIRGETDEANRGRKVMRGETPEVQRGREAMRTFPPARQVVKP